MDGCVEFESSMTGSTRTGPLKPPLDSAPLVNDSKTSSSLSSSSSFTDFSTDIFHSVIETSIVRSLPELQEQGRMRHKMTPVRPQSGQPIQLTPLWEHVVRTRRFPPEVDTRETFDEITERLRDPEWEVRQHALRVLVDVLPTLDRAIIDDAMTHVLPELVNNLGHLAPAVRKGALDTLRVYLVCSRRKDDIVRGILDDALSRQDCLDNFHTNVTLGVILSTPSLLFPSSSSPRPTHEILRKAIGALVSRLIQITHQEASIRSLVKIHEFIGDEEFDFYLNELGANGKRDYEVLRDVYKVKSSDKISRRKSGKTIKLDHNGTDRTKNNDCETTEINDNNCKNVEFNREALEMMENEDKTINLLMPPARIVLETEIKFNEETAITMTIIEQKDDDSDEESDFDGGDEFTKKSQEEVLEVKNDREDLKDDEITDEWIERRKTPRRVHFGGEIVKLRTPDSDDSELVQTEISQTRIPVPILSTTKITTVRTRKSRSNPCSPNVVRSKLRKSKSASNSPKREFYTHDASLSPKKSILARSGNNSAVNTSRTFEDSKKKMEARVDTLFGKQENDSAWAFEIYDNDDFPDSNLEKIDATKNFSPKINREIQKKKRNMPKENVDGTRNSEIGNVTMNESAKMIEDSAFPDTKLEKKDSTINPTSPKINREIPKKKRNSAKQNIDGTRNSEIGKIKINDDARMIDESVFPDSSLEKMDSTINPTSPKINREISKKKRNSAKQNIDGTRNSEIGEIKINDDARMIDESVFPIFSQEKIDSMTNPTSPKTNSKISKNKRDTAKTNIEFTTNNEISKIAVNESVKVESVDLVKGSRELLKSSYDLVQDKQERAEEPTRAPNVSPERKASLPGTRAEVGEKFEFTSGERNGRSLSLDSQPRSPKKLVFETFPRKERNYILMELSSPVKANTEKKRIDDGREKIDNQQVLKLPENNLSLSRGNSPMCSSVDHSFVARNEANGENEKINSSKNSQFRDSISMESNEIHDGAKMARVENEEVKNNFDIEENPLPDIVLNETTKFRESNWEELGLVDQEVLDDLHNKDDWRARVRGLERVASALRTSSALIAIEPRLGSLLQAVLGGERSCRVAAAGMAVARVVVAGVSEEALKRRLPQVAWGLARQGGPNAAQLARVAMLRLRPALLLEQLLQPHCIKARNAKTRENALQLLIFSLVTFPSTEFKVENVAYKVASMVGDRRRRVRQAALDTLAVLAQIYEPEEVTRAGKLAAKGQQDGDSMIAAIRARLARKSLPMVSADGLVVYGLQISPTVQIATGPDVDWIVAGSGSVSPGTGRTRGQIIATTIRQGVQEKNAKNESTKNLSSSRAPNFVALGVGLETKNEQNKPLSWQLVQHSAKDENHRTRDKWSTTENRDESFGIEGNETKSLLTGTLRQYRSASERLDDSFDSSDSNPVFILDNKDVIMKQRKTEENFHRRMDEIYAERTGSVPISQDIVGSRLESRIPVAQSRDRETSIKDTRNGVGYPRRRLNQREGNNLQNWSAGSGVSDISRPQSMHMDDQTKVDFNDRQRYQRIPRDSSPRNFSTMRDHYRSIYRQGRGYADGNVYREIQTAPTTTSYDVTRRRQSLKDTMVSRIIQDSRRIISSDAQTSRKTILEDSRSRRHSDERRGHEISTHHNGAKSTAEEEEINEINRRHFSVQANSYRIQDSNDRSSQCLARIDNGPSDSSSNTSSNASGENERSGIMEKINDVRNDLGETFVYGDDENIHASPSNSPSIEKSFDVITHETNPSRRNSIDYGISSRNSHSSVVVYTRESENVEYEETDKDSRNEDTSVPRVERHSSHENFMKNRVYPNDSSGIEETTNDRDDDRNIVIATRDYVTNDSNSSDGGASKISEDSPLSNESDETNVETLNSSTNPPRVDSLYAIRSIEEVDFDNSRSSTDENDEPEAMTMSYREYPHELPLKNVHRVISPVNDNDTHARTEMSIQRSSNESRESRDENTISILVASRPQSRNLEHNDVVSFETIETRQRRNSSIGNSIFTEIVMSEEGSLSKKIDETINRLSNFDESTRNPSATMTENFSRDTTNLGKINCSSNTGNELATSMPEVNGKQATTSDKSESNKKVGTSRVPRIRQKARANIARVAPMQPVLQTKDRSVMAKSKTLTQQCFTQLESNDWEIAIKGLKGLSEMARQQPEQLDSCAPGTIGRLLGRHIRNLRSQVSRAACLAAGDVFGSQARCIDQDLDDIAGPLLHRTADTNKFLRADSNEALDRMVEHLPPNKTIAVVVHRGATHQNAIVRATGARLLASIVDRVGSDWIMSLSRDVREKLIATGAKLLMDGNLDARNHAKRMFRNLSRSDGFRKALKDSVPETTLRHIDKTLRSL